MESRLVQSYLSEVYNGIAGAALGRIEITHLNAVLGKPITAKAWHQCVAESDRHRMMRKIAQTISSSTDLLNLPEEQQMMINFLNYAAKVEGNVYTAANSKDEYYEVLAAKIFIIKKALEKRPGVGRPVRAGLDSSSSSSDNSSSSSYAAISELPVNDALSHPYPPSLSNPSEFNELPVNDAISRPNIPRNASEFNCRSSQSAVVPSRTKFVVCFKGVGSRTHRARLKEQQKLTQLSEYLGVLNTMLKDPPNRQFLQSYVYQYRHPTAQLRQPRNFQSPRRRSPSPAERLDEPAPRRSKENVKHMRVPQPAQQSQPQPQRSNQSGKAISCGVCLDDLFEVQSLDGKPPVSTICGHLFCRRCIKTAMRSRHRCPVCRKRLKKKDYHPIYINQTGKAISCGVCLDDSLEVQSLDQKSRKQPASTICGHLFCRRCIKTVIRTRHCCPVCRKHLKKKDYHPIYM